MDPESRQLWASARSLEDLRKLNARWLQGAAFEHPCYGGPPDEETQEIVSDLVLLNRRGLLTTFSQPAAPIDEEGYGQRAAIEGLAPKAMALRIAALELYTDLLTFIYRPGGRGGESRCITVDGFHPFTWLGQSPVPHDVEEWEHLSPKCSPALRELWRVAAIDPKWGRKRYLWQQLRRVTNPKTNPPPFSVEPAPWQEYEEDVVRDWFGWCDE